MLPGWGNAHIGTWIEVGCKYRDLNGSQVGPENGIHGAWEEVRCDLNGVETLIYGPGWK